jgi:hypothetical protein
VNQKPGTERNFVNGFLIAIAMLLVGFAIYWFWL